MRTLNPPRVHLYIRARHSAGQHAFLEPVWTKNSRLRQGFALIQGQPQACANGIYYLRFLKGSKRVWQAVGPDPDRAIVALRNTQHDLEAVALGRKANDADPNVGGAQIAPAPATESHPLPPAVGTSLTDAIADYLCEVRDHISPKTLAAATHMCMLFGKKNPDRTIQSVTRADLLQHQTTLAKLGLSQRTTSTTSCGSIHC